MDGTIWALGVWATGVWADGVWEEAGAVDPGDPVPAGGVKKHPYSLIMPGY